MHATAVKKGVDSVDHYSLEAKMGHACCQVVTINKFCISKDLGEYTEMLEDLLLMLGNLKLKFISRDQAGKRMIVGFVQKINASCPRQFSKAIDNLRCIFFELVKRNAGDRECDSDIRMLPDDGEQEFIRGQITLPGYTLDDLAIESIVEISSVGANIKEPECA